jgi:hypothetical protein
MAVQNLGTDSSHYLRACRIDTLAIGAGGVSCDPSKREKKVLIPISSHSCPGIDQAEIDNWLICNK